MVAIPLYRKFARFADIDVEHAKFLVMVAQVDADVMADTMTSGEITELWKTKQRYAYKEKYVKSLSRITSLRLPKHFNCFSNPQIVLRLFVSQL